LSRLERDAATQLTPADCLYPVSSMSLPTPPISAQDLPFWSVTSSIEPFSAAGPIAGELKSRNVVVVSIEHGGMSARV
jgi:hypothetical protein